MPMNYVAKLQSKVAENVDDGREQDATTWNSNGNGSNVITLGNVSGSVYSGAFRFRHLSIPRNSKIVLARLRVRPSVTDGADPDVKLIVKGIKEPDTKPFTQTSRPSQRTKTVNTVAWHIIKKWEVHEWTQTPNLKLLIEEIVASASPILALWTLQDVLDLSVFRDTLLQVIAEKGDSAIASRTLSTIPDCGVHVDRLRTLAAGDV